MEISRPRHLPTPTPTLTHHGQMDRLPLPCHPPVLAPPGQPTPKPLEMGHPDIGTLW